MKIPKIIVILLTLLGLSCKSSPPISIIIEKDITIDQVKEDLLKMGISLKDEFKISENLADKEGEYQKTTLIISDIDKKQVELLCFPNNNGFVDLKDGSTFIFKIKDNELTYTFKPSNWHNDKECGTK